MIDDSLFRNPPKKYREIPFWSWNDDLEPEELRRQIALMDEAGWGGFFMHARLGLVTPYMGKRWMECIRSCVDEAAKRGMGAWLYDEDKWPSGFAGGLSVARDPAFRAQYLVCKVDNRPALVAERIATFAAREAGGMLVDWRPDDSPTFEDPADRLVQFYPQIMPLGMGGVNDYNDYAYLNVLNPQAVRAFIDCTYEPYREALGSEFGKAVPGMFTDEPQYLAHGLLGRGLDVGRPAIPWSGDFPQAFEARWGYDLIPHLPALFFDVGDFYAVRGHFWRFVTERFVESFTRPIYDWCEAHGLAFTGHYLLEDSLLSQVQWVGAVMPHYPYMHIPGIDKLARTLAYQWGNWSGSWTLTAKQLDSVACQTGKPRTLCENYGCNGQDFAHTGRKWLGDWAFAHGITLHNPHLSLYSMRGERKRDCPQNLYYQQPWWPENRLIADYWARLSYLLSQGQRVVDILVIHPMGSAWALYKPGALQAVEELDRSLDRLLTTLVEGQRDFHLGDELLMEPGAPCEGVVITGTANPYLQVGQMKYRLIVIPPGVTLAKNMVRLLGEFVAAGGPVLAVEPEPILVDGRPAPGGAIPAGARRVTPEALMEALDELLPFDVRLPGRKAILAHHRRAGDRELYFLANTSLESGGAAAVQLRGQGRLEEWDPVTGEIRLLPSRQESGVTETVLDFPPAGSRLLVLHPAEAAEPVADRLEQVIAEIPLEGDWQIAAGEPNAITLDTVHLRLGGAANPWRGPLHILDAHDLVKRAGLGTAFALRYHFDADTALPQPFFLALETPERFQITLNGKEVLNQDQGWWVDISFRKLDIGQAVQAGRNTLELCGTFGTDTELESVYLVGGFGVSGRRLGEEGRLNGQVFDRYAAGFRLVGPARDLQPAGRGNGLAYDLTAGGFPFFAGRVRLCKSFALPPITGRVTLEIAGLHAAVARARLNGQEAGLLAWPPHRLDLTAALRQGENQVELELVNTLRNLLGPHHLAGGDPEGVANHSFRDKSRWTDDYILVPFGFDGVKLLVSRNEQKSQPLSSG